MPLAILNLFRRNSNDCSKACTEVIEFLNNRKIGPNLGMSQPPYQKTDGYRYLNVTVRFNQAEANEDPVDLGIMFAYDSSGSMRARRYVNLEANIESKQPVNFIDVSGQSSWAGSQSGTSSYTVRIPVMGPYVQVFPFNRHSEERTVSIWGYLVS